MMQSYLANNKIKEKKRPFFPCSLVYSLTLKTDELVSGLEDLMSATISLSTVDFLTQTPIKCQTYPQLNSVIPPMYKKLDS